MESYNLREGARVSQYSEVVDKEAYLVILNCKIISLFSFLVGNLHKESAHECLSDVDVELSLVIQRHEINLETFHDSLELCADIFCLRERTCGYIIVPGPVPIVLIF